MICVLQHRARLVSGVKGCGLERPGLLRMLQDNCYFGLGDLTRVSCWNSTFTGVKFGYCVICDLSGHQHEGGRILTLVDDVSDMW